MKTTGVIGQRIARVKQGIVSRGHGYPPCNSVEYIELENGMRLYMQVLEAEAEYMVDVIVNKTAMRKCKSGKEE